MNIYRLPLFVEEDCLYSRSTLHCYLSTVQKGLGTELSEARKCHSFIRIHSFIFFSDGMQDKMSRFDTNIRVLSTYVAPHYIVSLTVESPLIRNAGGGTGIESPITTINAIVNISVLYLF